jgi:hypothetical protein
MGKHHVVPHAKGWAVKGEGKARASAVFATQEDAIAAAKRIAANQGGYVLIHRPDGTIRTEKIERITGTIKVDVGSGESLTMVQRKIERANKRLKSLAEKVATKKKKRDRKAAKKPAIKKPARASAAKKPAAKKPTAKSAATKRPAAKKAASRKPAAKKAASKKSAARKPRASRSAVKKPAARKAATRKSAGKPAAKKPAAKKSIGGKGLKVILASASKAVKKLVDKK